MNNQKRNPLKKAPFCATRVQILLKFNTLQRLIAGWGPKTSAQRQSHWDQKFLYPHQSLHHTRVCWNFTGLKKSQTQQDIHSDLRLSLSPRPGNSCHCQPGSESPRKSSRSKAEVLTKRLKGEASKKFSCHLGSLGLTGTTRTQRCQQRLFLPFLWQRCSASFCWTCRLLHLHIAKLTPKASNIKWITTLSTFLSPLQGTSYSETAFLVVWVLLFCF